MAAPISSTSPSQPASVAVEDADPGAAVAFAGAGHTDSLNYNAGELIGFLQKHRRLEVKPGQSVVVTGIPIELLMQMHSASSFVEMLNAFFGAYGLRAEEIKLKSLSHDINFLMHSFALKEESHERPAIIVTRQMPLVITASKIVAFLDSRPLGALFPVERGRKVIIKVEKDEHLADYSVNVRTKGMTPFQALSELMSSEVGLLQRKQLKVILGFLGESEGGVIVSYNMKEGTISMEPSSDDLYLAMKLAPLESESAASAAAT